MDVGFNFLSLFKNSKSDNCKFTSQESAIKIPIDGDFFIRFN